MRKDLEGLPCVYCVREPGTTEDHVFARAFLPPDMRGNLPKAPACRACNNQKSKLEDYLSTVMLFGSRTENARQMLEGIGARRLAQNEKLRRVLAEGRTSTLRADSEGGIVEATDAIPFDGERLHTYVALMTRGLCWHHWGVFQGPEFATEVFTPNPTLERFFAEMFSLRPAGRAGGDFGDGILSYQAVQGTDYPQMSLWRFQFYGGMKVADSSEGLGTQASAHFALTGHKVWIEGRARELLG